LFKFNGFAILIVCRDILPSGTGVDHPVSVENRLAFHEHGTENYHSAVG
jgi:hypothetical protein